MAVAFDAVGPSSAGTSASGTTLSWSHTCTGSNLYLIVGVAVGISAASATVSCTYNSVSMTNLGLQASNASTAGFVVMFGLANPATGAHTVAFTSGTSGTLTGGSMSLTGVGSIGTPAKTFGSGTTVTGTVTGVSATSMCAFVQASGQGGATITTGTSRWLKDTDFNTAAGNGAGATNTGTGSVSAVWPITSDWWGTVGVELLQAGAAAASPMPIVVKSQAVMLSSYR